MGQPDSFLATALGTGRYTSLCNACAAAHMCLKAAARAPAPFFGALPGLRIGLAPTLWGWPASG